MDGFFVTINCSKMLDSNETSYKIFIDKNKMSIVYELVEWIRFMFSLQRCFFLIHENSVIHELEDIRVLEILHSLEIRPCLRSNCIHQKMEKNLFNSVNLLTYWDEMRVHKLFQARSNYIIQKVTQNPHNPMKVTEKSNFSLQPQQDSFEESDQSKLDNNQNTNTSPFKLTQGIESNGSQVIDIIEKDVAYDCQLNLKKLNTSISDKNTNLNEMKSGKNSTDHNLEDLPHSNSDLFTETPSLSSVNKKQKIQCESKNNKKIGIPFSLGAFLSDIREKAQNQEITENWGIVQKGKSCSSVCSVDENDEDKNLHSENSYLIHNEGSLKRKRKRKHKKQNSKVDLSSAQINLSWDYFQPTVNAKPNHIRFNDTDETIETETIENNSKPFEKELVEFNPLEVSNNTAQQMTHLTTEPTPLIKKNENNENCLIMIEAQEEEKHSERLIDHNSEGLNCSSQTDNYIEKILDDSQQNLPDLESLKQKIKHPKICTRFY